MAEHDYKREAEMRADDNLKLCQEIDGLNAEVERLRNRIEQANRVRRIPMHESYRGAVVHALALLARCSDDDRDYGNFVMLAKHEWQAIIDAHTSANEENAKLRAAGWELDCEACVCLRDEGVRTTPRLRAALAAWRAAAGEFDVLTEREALSELSKEDNNDQ